MKWFKGANSTDWGIEISHDGLVTEIQYQSGMDRGTYKQSPKMHEEKLTGEVLHDAFWAIATSSKDGAYYLEKNVKNFAQRKNLFDVTMELNDLAIEMQHLMVESNTEK